MKDRNVQYPNRYRDKLTGKVIELESLPGTVTDEGSCYNKANVLPDSVCSKLEIPASSEPKDAFLLLDGRVRHGMIVMWSGAIADIPSGWALCDGANGTPDLRGRFVLGAGGNYAKGDTGGTESVTKSHTHSYSGTTSAGSGYSVKGGTSSGSASSMEHTHTYSGTTSARELTIDIMPPYLALAYLMKL